MQQQDDHLIATLIAVIYSFVTVLGVLGVASAFARILILLGLSAEKR